MFSANQLGFLAPEFVFMSSADGTQMCKINLLGLSIPGTITALSYAGITSTMVGLGNCNNTTDDNKPVSAATLTALYLKATLASPIFTGTVGGITSTMVGLGNCNNISDDNKPKSAATLTALNLKAPFASPVLQEKLRGVPWH